MQAFPSSGSNTRWRPSLGSFEWVIVLNIHRLNQQGRRCQFHLLCKISVPGPCAGGFYGKSGARHKGSRHFAVFNRLTCIAAVYAFLVSSLRTVIARVRQAQNGMLHLSRHRRRGEGGAAERATGGVFAQVHSPRALRGGGRFRPAICPRFPSILPPRAYARWREISCLWRDLDASCSRPARATCGGRISCPSRGDEVDVGFSQLE